MEKKDTGEFYRSIQKKVIQQYEESGKVLPKPRPTFGVLHFFMLFAGVSIGEILSAPFERLKILFQTGSYRNMRNIKKEIPVQGLLVMLKHISQLQGKLSHFRGLSANLYKQAFLLFFSISMTEQYKYASTTETFSTVLKIGFVTLLGSLFIYPLDVVHTKLAIDITDVGTHRKIISAWDYFGALPAENKLPYVYRGLSVQLASSLLYATLLSCGMKIWEKVARKKKRLTSLLAFGLMTFTAEIILYPLDTIKKRAQTTSKTIDLLSTLLNQKKTLDLRNNLFQGLSAHMIRAVIMILATGGFVSLPKLFY